LGNSFGHYSRIAVGPSIIEGLRKSLLGIGPFPTLVSILAIISVADNPADLTTLPSVAPEATGYQQVDWIMPGIGFTFLNGNKVPEGMLAVSLSQSPYCLAISPTLADRIKAAGIMHEQGSVATEKLQKKLDQI
jgi:hypothetical protein